MPATSMSPISASFAVSSLLHCHRRTVRYAASHRCGSSRSDRGVLRAPRLACDHSQVWTGYVPPPHPGSCAPATGAPVASW